MGHAYEGITADVIARYHRTTKPGAYFLTGSDEHGQKIAGVAEAQGVRPIEVTDRFVTGFQVLNQRQKVAQDDYMRTTSDRHKATCQELWRRCDKQGDIYLDNYEGWYNVREETFVTENDAKLTDYKDAVTGKPLNKVHESSYFFKMSKFQDRLKQHIRDNEAFIQPAHQRNYILKRLEEPLRDLSISRTTFDWGIAVPEGFEPGHVMYAKSGERSERRAKRAESEAREGARGARGAARGVRGEEGTREYLTPSPPPTPLPPPCPHPPTHPRYVWFDALTNYMSGVNALGTWDADPELPRCWPADCHLIGKDILWFHTVIWPTMLMSAGMPLPAAVFAHGFVNDSEGQKMSKSIGNVIDPHEMLDKYPVDSFRWYLCKEAPFGGELNFRCVRASERSEGKEKEEGFDDDI
jgi:methionyl-tRNA synthetase